MFGDAPSVLVARRAQGVVTEHQGVPVRHFKSGMVELQLARAHQEQGVVVHVAFAPVAAHEGAEHPVFGAHVNLIAGDEAESLLVPSLGGSEIGDVDDAVAKPLDALLRRFERHPLPEAHPVGPKVEGLALGRA